jgi:peptidoglycan/LPS O-acetylase OafA/YrhL
MTDRRLDYIDNIRILLTGIVILHHLAITYGAPGGWYFREFEVTELDLLPMITLVLFAASNQAYFMGFFFLLGGFFSAKSLSEKGTKSFLIQRTVRLGTPVLLFVYLISPVLRLSLRKILFNSPINLDTIRSTYLQLDFGYELGPMWFVVLLFIFSILLPFVIKSIQKYSPVLKIPSRRLVLLIAFLVGFVTFLVRIPFPIGTVYQPLNLQTPYLIQYLILFIFGTIIYFAGWNKELPSISLRFWLSLALAMAGLMPILFFLSGGATGDVTPALGGFHWQSLALSIWEQIFCACVITLLLVIFFNFFNQSTKLTRELAASSYTTYILHPLVLVILAAALHDFRFPPLLKIIMTAVPALLLCFASASLFRRIPGLRSIL